MSKKKTEKSPQLHPEKQTTKINSGFVFSARNGSALCGKKWHKILIAVFLLFILFPIGSVFAFEQFFSKKIYPGIKIGSLNLGGGTKEEALALLNQATKKYSEEGLTFVYQDKKTSLVPIVTAADDPDLSRTIFTLENEKTIEEAFSLGRNGYFLDNLKNQLRFLLYKQKIPLKHQYDNSEIEKILKEKFASFEKPAKDAKLVVNGVEPSEINSESPTAIINVMPEEGGRVFDYRSAINIAFHKVAELNFEPTSLNFIQENPKIKKEETAPAKERAKKLSEICSLVLSEGEKNWTIPQNQIREWLEFQLNPSGLGVGLNKDKVEEYFRAITPKINIQPQNARFKIENGVVKEFQVHQGGKELDLGASYTAINNYILNIDDAKISASCEESSKTEQPAIVHLIVKITESQIPIGSINNLGVKEMVGIGKSNFAGSPPNRRHNIKVGAAKLNGVLIAPGEEFSTNKALGEVSGSTGYLPELVIKGDKTIPEFGGGLCQIGTTMFRVALDAGLPITERRPHSYRVVYYEPAGMDATIYNPKPDLKFINDTPAYVLLQTKIEGDELTFEFWGTKDGRKTEIDKPRIYNFKSPGPTKIVETEDLAPGTKKCTERAHTGADAEFTRTVTLASGEVKTETWKSHYVPWSAVCLVGKEPAPPTENTPPSGETPSENPLPINENTNININANTNSPTF